MNAKSTNTNLFDDIGVIMTNVLNDNSETGWLFEDGATFIENLDGTAQIKGTIKQFGDYSQIRRFEVDLTLSGQTFTPPPGSPYNKTDVPTEGWYYYTSISGTFTGLDGIAGGKLGIVLHMKAFQAGIGANQIQDEPLDKITNGASGWFEWTVLQQPTTGILFNDYIMNTTVADIAMLLEGSPSVPCCTAKAGTLSLSATELILDANGTVTITGTPSTNSEIPAGYRLAYILTQGDSSVIKEVATSPTFDVTETGKYCIHTLVYNPSTLDLRGIGNDIVKINDIAYMLSENGGNICASVNTIGSCVTVKEDPCLNDKTPPTIVCPANITVSTNSHCGIAQWTEPKATDNCGNVTIKMTSAPVAGWQNGSCFPIGTTTITYTATDDKGNSTSCSFDITVISTCDNVTNGGTIVKKCVNKDVVLSIDVLPVGGTGSIEYQWMKSIYACPDSMEHGIIGANNSFLNVGNVAQTTYYRLCSRRAGCNNWVGETDCITVQPNECDPCATDSIAPVITCPANISLNTTSNCAIATWNAPVVTDNCSTPSVSSNYNSGFCFPLGTSTVTYTAIDEKGNKSTCSFTVTVTKTGSIGDQTYYDFNNSGTFDAGDMPATNLTITLFDESFNQLSTQTVDAVTGKYLFTGLMPGTYWIAFPTATLDGYPLNTVSPIKVVLAAGEDFLDADAGYYLNPCDKDTTVPTFSDCPANITLTTTGTCAAATWIAPKATDNCSTPTVTSTHNSGFCFPVGTTTVTYTATDSKGNKATCSFTVTVTKQDPCAGVAATAYADCSYTGKSVNLNVGRYTLAQLQALGLSNDVLSSMKVNAGFTIVLYENDNFCGKSVVLTANNSCLTDKSFNDLTSSIIIICGTVDCSKVSGNTISVTCLNNTPVLTGTALEGFEYQWMCGNTSCPTQASQAIPGATSQNYTPTTAITATTYFIRCARPIGCATWGPVNESNCISVKPTDCNPCANDVAAPVFSNCPTNISLNTTGTCAAATWAVPKATDNCCTPSVSCTYNSGYCFPVGTTTVTYTATDNKGNKATCSFTVTVIQTCKPKLTFNNKCNYSVNIYLDNNGTKVKYACIAAGQSWSCTTSDKTKWMVCNASTNAQVATYTVAGCTDQVCNINSTQNCDVVFWNKTYSTCNVYWINNFGQKVFYKTLNSGQCYTQPTYMGHKWMICNSWGQTLSNYTVYQYGTSWCNVYSNSCNWWALSSAQVLTLDARLIDGRTAINWVNNTSFKNDYFAVQRLNNVTGEFDDLKLINNLKDTNDMLAYTEYDENPQDGENIYRVKVAYADGTFGYTENKTVKNSKSNGIRLYPNPATELINIDLSEYRGNNVNIYLYNQFGQQVEMRNVESAGDAPVILDVTHLTTGSYIIRISAKGKREVTKQISVTK